MLLSMTEREHLLAELWINYRADKDFYSATDMLQHIHCISDPCLTYKTTVLFQMSNS